MLLLRLPSWCFLRCRWVSRRSRLRRKHLPRLKGIIHEDPTREGSISCLPPSVSTHPDSAAQA